MDNDRQIAALQAELRELRQEVAELRTGRVAAPDDSGPTAGPLPETDPTEASDGRTDRRALLRRGGVAAAAAVVGGTAAAAMTASPAAAVTVSGSGNPGVSGSGVGGDGVVGTSDSVGKSGVYAYTSKNAGIALTTRHFGTGNAIEAYPTNGKALYGAGASDDGILGTTDTAGFAGVHGTTGTTGGVGVFAEHTGTGVALQAASTLGHAIQAIGNGGNGIAASTTTATYAAIYAATTVATAYGGFFTNSAGGTALWAQSQANGTAFEAQAAGGGTAAYLDSAGAHLLLNPHGAPAPTRATAYSRGAIVEDVAGDLWLCVANGTPGTWRKLSGPATAGALHVLPAPVRVYDSRPGQPPLGGIKGAFTDTQRVIDAKNASSGVPADASAVLVNLAVTNTNSGGFGALFKNGIAWPGNASINWGVSNTTISNMAITAVDASALFLCKIAGTADVIVDVIGYYR